MIGAANGKMLTGEIEKSRLKKVRSATFVRGWPTEILYRNQQALAKKQQGSEPRS